MMFLHTSACFRFATAALLTLCLVHFTGCEKGGRDLSLDEDAARRSFAAFLDAWKEGKTPADLRNASPEIVAGDPDWEAGRKLVAWTIAPDELNDGANLHLTADLDLAVAGGKSVRRRVIYVVGTEPTITIFRK